MDLQTYVTESGRIPFKIWIDALDRSVKVRVQEALLRIASSGHFGKSKPVGEGVFELKFKFGGGVRVYYAFSDRAVVLLLLGGNKRHQDSDIKKAKDYWRDYIQRQK